MPHRLIAACLLLLSLVSSASAQAADDTAWGDSGDGTYVNPVLPGDYSDLDAIRVGSDYYAISSTFQFSPGVVILHSKDMVNWRILGHAVNDITSISPEMKWDRMNRYGRGIWAGAIRHHAGKFWIYFGTPQEGYFMTTARNPEGPWEPLHQVMNAEGWDDCCPFWDDDGQGYLVGTHFKDQYNIYLFKLSADGKELVKDSRTLIHAGENGSEANKLYKINGVYYHLYSHVDKREGRVVMMQRSKSLAGPWETRQLIHVNPKLDREPNQGGLVQLETGDWWFLTHHGTGGHWEGRTASLLPVAWVDGWPILGQAGPDGIGSMVWSHKKPIHGFPGVIPQRDDEFNDRALAPQWEWNYQPRPDKWSLSERPGYLRLYAFKPLDPGNLLKAGNTLTQRSMRTDHNEVTVRMEIDSMADGQHAGLCHFSKTYCWLGVSQSGDNRRLVWCINGKVITGPKLAGSALWLRSTWGSDGVSQYAYSTDGKRFTSFGSPYQLGWGFYRGDRIGIFSFNDKGENGYLDVDWFHHVVARPQRQGQ